MISLDILEQRDQVFAPALLVFSYYSIEISCHLDLPLIFTNINIFIVIL
jgi:hypothetical protein